MQGRSSTLHQTGGSMNIVPELTPSSTNQLVVKDQISSSSNPQPVPLVQPALNSPAVHRRAFALAQMASASANVFSPWQPPMPFFELTHSPHSRTRRNFSRAVSEQQRTSWRSDGSAHRVGSGQLPARPHSTFRGGGDCGGEGGCGTCPCCGGGAGGGERSGFWSLDQISSSSNPQPVPRLQSLTSSSAVHRRAFALAQMASASANVFSPWQPPIPASDSAHGQSTRCCQPLICVSEQQRTSC
mmetsp:Transcript_32137/g.96052  ORF Transcript_32137/g.96052 Transcript_32137/m.96052 type:complete len:243 (-) Transcript_32137:173-901(-)